MINSKTPTDSRNDRLFRKLTLFAVITVYLLIAAGGIVRSTGSGMGCPDWPKCFGSWVPPTEAYQLPSNYKELYGAKLKGEVEFNVVKTWTEYVNRLLGVFTGILIFGTLLASVPYLRTHKSNLFYASLAAFILVGIQGWLGSKVVSTELHPLMVTLHMVVAIVIVFILIYTLIRSYPPRTNTFKNKKFLLVKQLIVLSIVLSFGQVMLGTQVREAMDGAISMLGYDARSQWIEQLGLPFYIHRSFSLVVLGVNTLLVYQIWNERKRSRLRRYLIQGVIVVILLEIFSGIVMAYFSVPAFAQPIHLTLAIVMLGTQYSLWLESTDILSAEKKQMVGTA
ncbi:COX15/CtaA family protein [Salmonirosea aquatica]|uniref:Heme A synthase n=1 Tax=Salmonirosea aquatica TaxID=2654236 RepID=A0A7C9BA26_9BACT|nr:heme A synthase [Cytophagaceae bacterium SJW1-29]